MSCSVYCLVSSVEQLDSLMKSLARAGLAREGVTVVWRSPVQPHRGRRNRAGAPEVPPPWYLPLVPSAWWWSLGVAIEGQPTAPVEPAPRTQVVVPYATLQARRLRNE